MNSDKPMQRNIGAVGAAVTLVGFVVGISIFVLPGTLAASTGPAVMISYAIAAMMAVFSCVVAAQVGSVLPVSGASFVVVSRTVSPFIGFAMVWLIIGGATVAVALLASGFADYLILLWPGVDRQIAALLLVFGLGGLNLLGIRDTVIVQGVMVVFFLGALMIFSGAALYNIDTGLLIPFAPNGFTPVLVAAIPAFFSFAGFMVIIEIGGEIRNPARNIPLALAISFTTVLIIYSLVSLSIVGVIPWTDLSDSGAPVGEAAAIVLPAWLAKAITLTAIAAAASSVNVMLLGYSRDILALAQTQALPSFMARISAKHGEPVNGVLLMTMLSAIAVMTGGDIEAYATVVVFGLLLAQIAIGLATRRLPEQLPALFQNSAFKLRPGALSFFSYGLIVLSIIFLLVVILDSPKIALIVIAYLSLGIVYYFARRHWLIKHGISIEARISEVTRQISIDEDMS